MTALSPIHDIRDITTYSPVLSILSAQVGNSSRKWEVEGQRTDVVDKAALLYHFDQFGQACDV